jgi:SAM-dependent methyltransferase
MNPWNSIPLEDYESHMSDASVGQLSLLNSLTKKYLNIIQPPSVIFLGVAGGNGLEHIDNSVTKTVIGIDINQDYLYTTFQRYHEKISQLKLICYDITKSPEVFCKADMIWAALILEYTGIENSLEFSSKNLAPGGHFILTIQSNHDLHSVSDTGIESVKKVADIFHPVDHDILLDQAASRGFAFIEKEENILPNGKALITYHFIVSN